MCLPGAAFIGAVIGILLDGIIFVVVGIVEGNDGILAVGAVCLTLGMVGLAWMIDVTGDKQ
jgi:hypothetical protein